MNRPIARTSHAAALATAALPLAAGARCAIWANTPCGYIGRVARLPVRPSLIYAATPPNSRAHGGGRKAGLVVGWNTTRNFGFIVPHGGGRTHFCHGSSVSGIATLQAGDAVEYSLRYSRSHEDLPANAALRDPRGRGAALARISKDRQERSGTGLLRSQGARVRPPTTTTETKRLAMRAAPCAEGGQ